MKNICVFAGSGAGANPQYAAAAGALGHAMVDRHIGLVYGGARIGLMGAIADAVLSRNGSVIGVIPEFLEVREVAHAGLTELHVVRSMHERKALMADRSDAFIAMPGGLGTLDELFEILTWSQLGLHQKPIGLLNVRGYFDGLLAFVDHMTAEGFVTRQHRPTVVVNDDPHGLLDAMLAASRLPRN